MSIVQTARNSGHALVVTLATILKGGVANLIASPVR